MMSAILHQDVLFQANRDNAKMQARWSLRQSVNPTLPRQRLGGDSIHPHIKIGKVVYDLANFAEKLSRIDFAAESRRKIGYYLHIEPWRGSVVITNPQREPV